jgi:hypothetical protein
MAVITRRTIAQPRFSGTRHFWAPATALWTGPTPREQQDAVNNSGGALQFTAATAVNADTILVIAADNFYLAADLLTPTGTAVTTWALAHTLDGGTNDSHIKVWLGTVTTAGGTVITNWNHTDNERYAGIWVFPGAVAIDAVASTDSDAAATDHVAPSVTPTTGNLNNLLIVLWQSPGGEVNYVPPSIMLSYGERDLAGLATYLAASEPYAVDTATGTRTATSSASVTWAALSVLVKPAVAATLAIAGTATQTSTAAATLTMTAAAAGAATQTSTAAAALTRITPVTATATETSTAAAALNIVTVHAGAGTATQTSTAAAALTIVTPIAAAATETSTATAALTLTAAIAGAATETSSAAANLTRITPIAAAATETSTAAAALTITTGAVTHQAAGTATQTSTAVASLRMTTLITAAAIQTATALAALTQQIALPAGSATLTSSAHADLLIPAAFTPIHYGLDTHTTTGTTHTTTATTSAVGAQASTTNIDTATATNSTGAATTSRGNLD